MPLGNVNHSFPDKQRRHLAPLWKVSEGQGEEEMKAITYATYGGPDVLHVTDLEKPHPKDNEALIRVRAVSVNFGDIIARNFKNVSPREFNMPFLFWLLARFGFGFSRPKKTILGNAFSGEVETIGKGVTLFKKGDAVFGYTGENMGAYAEYLCFPEQGIIAAKPSNMTFEEAAAVPYGAIMALDLLKKANLRQGQRVLVLGASGAIGSAAVQLARQYYGAEVTGVCGAAGADYVKNLGANQVIDYTKEDFTQNGAAYDLIVDILGRETFSQVKASLTPTGIYLSVSFKMKKLLQMIWTSVLGGKRVLCALASPKREDLTFIKGLVEDGKMKSVLDQCFPLEKAAEAHRFVESENKKGAVVIRI